MCCCLFEELFIYFFFIYFVLLFMCLLLLWSLFFCIFFCCLFFATALTFNESVLNLGSQLLFCLPIVFVRVCQSNSVFQDIDLQIVTEIQQITTKKTPKLYNIGFLLKTTITFLKRKNTLVCLDIVILNNMVSVFHDCLSLSES